MQDLSGYRRIAAKVDSFEREMRGRSDDELRRRHTILRGKASLGADLDALLPPAFAIAREAARRALGERMYDEQILGAIALHHGAVVEMNTGEGKTLTAIAPAYLHGVTGRGVHILTSDDYLARRDAEWMTPVFALLGMTCGLLDERTAEARRAAYAADVTYGAYTQFCYDFLRDGGATRKSPSRQRERRFAIVDEADLVMLDEAFAQPELTEIDAEDPVDHVRLAAVAQQLGPGSDYRVDQRRRTLELTDAGIANAGLLLGVAGLGGAGNTELRYELWNALLAKEFYRRDDQYIVEDGQIRMVDWHTGRVADGFMSGVVPALAVKEGLPTSRRRILAKISVRGYLRGYHRLSAMTGVAAMEAEAYQVCYGLPVVTIAPHRPIVRVDRSPQLYPGDQQRMAAVVREVVTRNAKGQPVLVGTGSIEYSEQVSAALTEAGVSHRLLNAKQHADEAEIIARAGELGAVTVITKMAGRGVDIRLGGDSSDQRAEVVAAGGMFVLGTNVFQTWRLERHLRGRAGRQGDPGESAMFYSIDDPNIRAMLGPSAKLTSRMMRSSDTPIAGRFFDFSYDRRLRRHAAAMSARLAKGVAYDVVFDEQREQIQQRRRAALDGDDLHAEVIGLIDQLVENKVTEAERAGQDEPTLRAALAEFIPAEFMPAGTTPDEAGRPDYGRLRELLRAEAREAYDRCEAKIDVSYPNLGIRYGERYMTQRTIDRRWPRHLGAMETLWKASATRRAENDEQRLAAYRAAAADLFADTVRRIDEGVVRSIFGFATRPRPDQ